MKKALIIGINYPKTSHALMGCVNDAIMIKDLLLTKFKFTSDDIRTITDNDATTKNMKDGLVWLVANAKKGDVLFFSYSGHGSQLPNYSKEAFERDGLDEVIIPVDIDWRTKIIRDDYLKWIFNKVPHGTSLTVILDACNSGSGMDYKNRFKPFGQGVAKEVPKREIAKFLPPPPEIFEGALLKQKTRNMDNTAKAAKKRKIDRAGLLISGCQEHQTSADAYINGKFSGACTTYLVDILKKSPKITYKQLVTRLNKQLIRKGFTQRPELNGSKSLFNSKIMLSTKTDNSQVVVTTTKPKPKPICRRCKKVKNKCKCSQSWKRYYWRSSGPWKRYYKHLLKLWRRRNKTR